MTEALLAILHHFAVFAVFGILLAEHMLLQLPPTAPAIRLLGRIDLIYGISAGVAVLAGIGRILHGIKGTDFYLGNPLFWTKMGVFALIGLISIGPTLRFLAWNKSLQATNAVPDATAWAQPLRLVRIQLALFVSLPLLAVLMARGFGLGSTPG